MPPGGVDMALAGLKNPVKPTVDSHQGLSVIISWEEEENKTGIFSSIIKAGY